MSEKPEENPSEIPVEVEVEPAAGEAQAEAPAEPAEDPVAALQKRVAELENEKQATYDRLVRTAADLENFRKRTRRELDDARVDERFKVLKEVLPVLDNLERAVEHAEKGEDAAQGVLQGVQLVLRQFAQALERTDVVGFDAAGQPFDPNLHEAISQLETDEVPPGTVVKVLQRGYKAGTGRLLRPALVVVARPPVVEEGAGEPGGGGNGEDKGNGRDPASGDGGGEA
jgi:molecular chaperone GrpE